MKNKNIIKLLIKNSTISQYYEYSNRFYFETMEICYAGIPLWIKIKIYDCQYFFFIFSKTSRKILKVYNLLHFKDKEKKVRDYLLNYLDKNTMREFKINDLK